jgi:hypothetical protein
LQKLKRIFWKKKKAKSSLKYWKLSLK